MAPNFITVVANADILIISFAMCKSHFHRMLDGFLSGRAFLQANGLVQIMDAWIYPLLLSIIGGPAAMIFRRWYGKKDVAPSKFRDAGTYVRDDSLYSYDDKKKDASGQ